MLSSGGKSLKYAAFSHVWGGGLPLRTTKVISNNISVVSLSESSLNPSKSLYMLLGAVAFSMYGLTPSALSNTRSTIGK